MDHALRSQQVAAAPQIDPPLAQHAETPPAAARTGRPLRTNLRSMMGDAAAFSLMVGAGETYVPAFALALGLSEVGVGLIATLPILAGAVLQLVSPWAVRRLRSHRQWVVGCAIAQAGSLLLLVPLAFIPALPAWLVFVPATLYWAAGQATGPTWNAWVEQLVPSSIRPMFFARRVRVSHVGVLTGLIAGGLLLRFCPDTYLMPMFAVLFAASAVSRLYSAAMLARQTDSDGSILVARPAQVLQLASQPMRRAASLRIVGYLLAVQTGVYIAAPYFTPFMLAELKLSYTSYMLLLGCGFLGKIVAMPLAGKLCKRLGAQQLLWLGGAGIIPMSACWIVSDSLPYLVAIQLISGVAWAMYELATFLVFFEAVPQTRRIAMLTLFNLANAAAMVIGALVGAALIEAIGPGRGAFFTVFAISSVARLVACGLMPRKVPALQDVPFAPQSVRTVAVRPAQGSLDRPVLPVLFEPSDADSTPVASA